MRTSLFTEFRESTALGRTDTALTTQLRRHYKTDALLTARRGLPRSTCVALAWNIQQARVIFKGDPALIRGVISSAASPNALAAWGDQQRHWIVVTDGLMTALRDAAEGNAARVLAAFPAAFASASGRCLLAATPLQGFDSMPGALLYFGAMSIVLRGQKPVSDEPIGNRLRGMQSALHDPAFHAHMQQVDAGFLLFRDNLRASL